MMMNPSVRLAVEMRPPVVVVRLPQRGLHVARVADVERIAGVAAARLNTAGGSSAARGRVDARGCSRIDQAYCFTSFILRTCRSALVYEHLGIALVGLLDEDVPEGTWLIRSREAK